MKVYLCSLILSLCCVISLHSQTWDDFYAAWGSVAHYFTYCLDSLDSDDIDYLVSHADDNDLVYFTVFVDTNTIIFPVLVSQLKGYDEQSLDLE